MKVKPTISIHDIKLLDKPKYKKFLIVPSAKVFYGDRPYKVSLNILKEDDKLIGDSQRYHWWAWQDLLKLACGGQSIFFRTQGRFPDTYMFFYEREGVDLLIKNYPDRINYISGPIHQEHLEKISGNKNILVRKNLFYNQYLTKVDCFVPWHGYGSYQKRQSIVSEVREYIQDNLGSGRMSTCRWKASFFVNQDELSDILPFLKLQWPQLQIDYTEIYYPDSL